MAYVLNNQNLLWLMHLVSPALPVGAYSYSEGLEALTEQRQINTAEELESWLRFELCYGGVRTEAGVMIRAYQAVELGCFSELQAWQDWLRAFRETEEVRSQSLQMGRSLLRLLRDTQMLSPEFAHLLPEECPFAIAFAIAAASRQLGGESALLGYLHSWLSNLVNAGVRLIPLGQTAGQQILFNLYPLVDQSATEILGLTDADLCSCNWGTTLASMQHETLYSRLFRS